MAVVRKCGQTDRQTKFIQEALKRKMRVEILISEQNNFVISKMKTKLSLPGSPGGNRKIKF